RRATAACRLSFAESANFSFSVRPATEQDPVGKEPKTDSELEDMILQRLLIGGVFVSVRKDPILGWRPTVVTAPKHTKNAQELADKIATELRKKFTLKEPDDERWGLKPVTGNELAEKKDDKGT